MNKTYAKLIILLALILTIALLVPKCEAHWPHTRTIIRGYYWYPLNHRKTTFIPTHKIATYGGTNNRPEWTGYYAPDTSFGYRTHRPTAKDLGIQAPHKYGNPNPRSLYR